MIIMLTNNIIRTVSEKFKEIRRKQIPHTCSRKGMARLSTDMKRNSVKLASVTRVKVWIKAHKKKDGTPVNTPVGETIGKIRKVDSDSTSSSTTNVREDVLSQVLGQDKPRRLRGMGRGVTMTKVSFLQAREKHVKMLEENQANLQGRINQLAGLVHTLIGHHQTPPNVQAENEKNEPRVNKTSTMQCIVEDDELEEFESNAEK